MCIRDRVIIWLKAAARQQRVRQAHDGGVAELDAYRELIVPLQERSVNDAEYVSAVVDVYKRQALHGVNLDHRVRDGSTGGEHYALAAGFLIKIATLHIHV